jgi:CRISPR-associated protein Csb2
MTALIFRFPGRRYHATPWGHHVNEGLIEWPPSPWRLLRALIATGYGACGWDGGNPPAVARSLIEKLARVDPKYRLPPAVGTHSRHYMPTAMLDQGRERTTLVFDAWAQIDEGELVVSWGVELQPSERTVLSELASRMGYLGRSESWVEARLAEDGEVTGDAFNSHACDEAPHRGWEQVSLLAPVSCERYASWRQAAVEQMTATLSPAEANGKRANAQKLAEAREKILLPYPVDLVSCLQVDTAWLQRHGWNQPPGSRRVLYWRKTDALEVGTSRQPPPRRAMPSVEAMLLAIATPSSNAHALPNVSRALPLAEQLHRQLVAAACRRGTPSFVLTGCDENRRPLKGMHGHAHILPLDLDGDDRLDHLLLWAPLGFDALAQEAVRSVRKAFAKSIDLRLAVSALGDRELLRKLAGRYGDALRRVLGPPQLSATWVSETPFVPPRFVKKSGSNTLEGQIAAELASRNFPAATEVSVVAAAADKSARKQRHFIRVRREGPAPPVDCGFTVRIRLVEPVPGPVCLGYGSHFGLGRFVAEG